MKHSKRLSSAILILCFINSIGCSKDASKKLPTEDATVTVNRVDTEDTKIADESCPFMKISWSKSISCSTCGPCMGWGCGYSNYLIEDCKRVTLTKKQGGLPIEPKEEVYSKDLPANSADNGPTVSGLKKILADTDVKKALVSGLVIGSGGDFDGIGPVSVNSVEKITWYKEPKNAADGYAKSIGEFKSLLWTIHTSFLP